MAPPSSFLKSDATIFITDARHGVGARVGRRVGTGTGTCVAFVALLSFQGTKAAAGASVAAAASRRSDSTVTGCPPRVASVRRSRVSHTNSAPQATRNRNQAKTRQVQRTAQRALRRSQRAGARQQR